MKYRIGVVSRILGISAETLRFFETKGIILPEKNESNNYRYYDTLDVHKLVAYKFFRSMEFSMDKSMDMLQVLSHTQSIDEMDKHIDLIQEKISYYEALLHRTKELKESYKKVEEMENEYRIEYFPEIILYYNQINDVIGIDNAQREVSQKWLSFMPFIWLAFHIPKNEIQSGKVAHWGYAIETKYENIALELRSPYNKKITSQKSVNTVFKLREGEKINDKLFGPMNFIKENNLTLNGDAIGYIINEERDEYGIVRYFEVWLPVK